MRKIILTILSFLIISSPCYAIRIGLLDGARQTYIGSSRTADLIDARTGKLLYTIHPLTSYTIRPYGTGMFAIKINKQEYKLKTNWLVLRPRDKKCLLATKKRWYRGEFVLYNVNRKITLINRLPIEEYLLGVVPSEMPSKWNLEAHKAQAIAARSYAVANLGKRGSRGYDLKDTPHDQAYGGATSERPNTTHAVLSTKGVIMTYNNKVISAYYHASSGGQTVNSNKVWANSLPYLHSVYGYDKNVRKMGHGVGMSQYGANNLAGKGYNSFQILSYFYNNIKFASLKSSL